MDNQKIAAVARKVEALALGYIGVFIFSMGTSYFQERFLYRVPRILIPVFDVFGGVGLAIGMLILGSGLIYYGFTLWKSVSEKRNLYLILTAAGLVAGVALANLDFNPGKAAGIMEEMDKRRASQMDELRNSDELSFSNAEVDEHIARYNALYERYEAGLKSGDEAAVAECEKEFGEWITKTAAIMQGLNDEEKVELARYQAKLAVRWSDLR
ncbi:MAG: hypothetical protein LBK07_00355 [Tannerella sp.]|jgi:hypothetical protein|nr:hypothetical protein [Tannerella sp.]